MSYHGLRVAEVANLPLEALDLDSDPATIRIKGKRGKVRKAHLTDNTASILSAWLDIRGRYARPEEKAVFVALSNRSIGHQMTTRGLRHLVDRYLEQAGLKVEGVSCHTLRHSFGTWARAGGAKLGSIQDALGHTSIDHTRIYAKIVDKMKENPTRFLEAMLAG